MTAATISGEPASHGLDGSRGGSTTKVQLVCDTGGARTWVGVDSGYAAEARSHMTVLACVRIAGLCGSALTKPKAVIADRGYDARGVRAV